MRILHYTNTFFPLVGGAEYVIHDLATAQARAGHEVIVYASKPGLFGYVHEREAAYEVIRYPRFISKRKYLNWYARQLTRLCNKRHPDVIHSHGVYPNTWLAVKVRNRLRETVKMRLQHPVVLTTTHGEDVSSDDRRYQHEIIGPRMKDALDGQDQMVIASHMTLKGFQERAGDAAYTEIPHGVDLTTYARVIDQPDNVPTHLTSGDYLMFIGRLVERKGVDVLLKAWAEAGELGKRLVIVGDGEEISKLKTLASELRIGQWVDFTGSLEGDAKVWLLQNAWASVVPSRRWEAVGIVALEAMAAGTPVIVSDLPGLGDLVNPEENGWHFSSEDVASLSRALTHVCRLSESTQQNHVHHAKAYAAMRSWDVMAARYVDLYEKLLNARGSG